MYQRYCLRKRKGADEIRCRFKFPFALAEVSLLKKMDGKLVLPKRNNSKLNKNNCFILQLWSVNMDVQPIVSIQDVLNYIAKYAAKAEVQSESYQDVLKQILAESKTNDEARTAVRSFWANLWRNEITPRKKLFIL